MSSGFDSHLAALRSEYSDKLQRVRNLDRLVGRPGANGLAARLLSRDKWGKGVPQISKLKFPIKWDKYPIGSQYDVERAFFNPPKSEKGNLMLNGWTTDKFLRMMYQIPEMEVYLQTNGYGDFNRAGTARPDLVLVLFQRFLSVGGGPVQWGLP